MLRSLTAVVLVWIQAIFIVPLVSVKGDESVHTIEQIRDAWQQREDAVQTFYMKFRTTIVQSRGLRGDDLKKARREQNHLAAFDTFTELRISDTHYDIRGHKVNPDETPWLPPSERNALNKAGYRSIFAGMGSSGSLDPTVFDETSSGAVGSAANEVEFRTSPEMTVPFLVYRPIGKVPKFFPLEHASIVSQSVPLGDLSCVLLRLDDPDENWIPCDLWLDPGRGYLPVRYVTLVRERPSTYADIAYSRVSDDHYELTSWKITEMNFEGEMSWSGSSEVLECRLNPEIPESDFEIQFPVGAEVRNFDTNRKFISGTDDSGLKTTQASTPFRWMIVAGLFGVACVLVLMGYRRFHND